LQEKTHKTTQHIAGKKTHTHTQNQTPKLQQKTQNHIVLDCRKKHKANTQGGSLGHRVRLRHKAWGGRLFNVC